MLTGWVLARNRYKSLLTSKNRYIKRLEMENELMWVFILFTEVRTSVKYMVIYRHKDKYSISEM